MGNQFNFLQADLDETLYRITDPAKVTISSNKFNSADRDSGGNGSIFIYRPKHGNELTTAATDVLNNMIKAVRLTVDESIRLNFNNLNTIHIQQLTNNYSIKHLICFGLSPSELSLHVEVPDYEYFTLNEISFLFADALEDLIPAKKQKLWKALQEMYHLND